jgi:hypothetical protein
MSKMTFVNKWECRFFVIIGAQKAFERKITYSENL